MRFDSGILSAICKSDVKTRKMRNRQPYVFAGRSVERWPLGRHRVLNNMRSYSVILIEMEEWRGSVGIVFARNREGFSMARGVIRKLFGHCCGVI